ncbi:MAG: threonine ammonia-lyase [bacterium]
MIRRNLPVTSIDEDSAQLFQLDSDTLAKARRQLSPFLCLTPLLQSKVDSEIYFKTENLQRTGSFKIRPALSQLIQLTEAEKKRGIVTSSSGNFAQGVAYAAKCFNLSAKIVMMQSSNPMKVRRTEQLGGEVVFCKDDFDARQQKVDEIRDEEGRTEVHPYDRVPAVVGNATIGAEILEQLAEVESVIVPVSGGGLISGVASALKLLKPEVQVYGVQPEGSNSSFLSFHKRQPVTIDRAVTIADGLMVTRPGRLTFELIKRHVDDFFVVKEDTLLEGVRTLLLEEKLVAEPSAVVTIAAVLEGHIKARNTVCLLSGGNVNPELLAQVAGK